MTDKYVDCFIFSTLCYEHDNFNMYTCKFTNQTFKQAFYFVYYVINYKNQR